MRAALAAFALASVALAVAQEPWPVVPNDSWVATDALGRSLPGYREVGPPRRNRFIGIFYFLWMQKSAGQGLYDISKLLAANAEKPAYGPVHAFHWWGEPALGYYLSEDEFVIRRHAQMLGDAGVDVMVFDVTNAFTYESTYLTVCRVLRDVRASGRPAPQVAFLAHSYHAKVVKELYDRFYSKGLYSDLWFRWKGKPLILSSTEGLSDEVRAFFTFRRSWAWSDPGGWFGDGRDRWPWLDHTPQRFGWHESPDKPEQIPVAVAQHATTNLGRSFHDGRQPPPDEQAPERGLYFEEQWRRAREVDPEFVFVTGWNEWIAQRFVNQGGTHFLGRALAPGETFFVDAYNQEYSRDIEPMRGGHGDNYYYQLIANVRRYKGLAPAPRASAPRSIEIGGDFAQWQAVQPEFRDDRGDVAHRDHEGWKGAGRYRNRDGRNDLLLMKATHDAQSAFFYLRSRDPLRFVGQGVPLTLWISPHGGNAFRVRGFGSPSGRAKLERFRVGAGWQTIAGVQCHLKGREVELTVPLALLRLRQSRVRFDFKWADNVDVDTDVLNVYRGGDAAPNGRFRYRYVRSD